MEERHDWAKMVMTPELFKYVFKNLLPEVIVHSQSQDEEQVRDHYDSKSPSTFYIHSTHLNHVGGDDFYSWFVSSTRRYSLLHSTGSLAHA
jgi:hypothetical protein